MATMPARVRINNRFLCALCHVHGWSQFNTQMRSDMHESIHPRLPIIHRVSLKVERVLAARSVECGNVSHAWNRLAREIGVLVVEREAQALLFDGIFVVGRTAFKGLVRDCR